VSIGVGIGISMLPAGGLCSALVVEGLATGVGAALAGVAVSGAIRGPSGIVGDGKAGGAAGAGATDGWTGDGCWAGFVSRGFGKWLKSGCEWVSVA
jgi:hypothetical protein